MNDDLLKIVVTGAFMVLVAVITGLWARSNKKVAEPTPIERLWDRLDKLEAKAQTQGETIETQGGTISRLTREVTALKDTVVAYRGGFLAHVSWADRVQAAHTGSTPIVAFTPGEQAAIRRGLDMVALERLSADEDQQA
jgi:hypothetical protein